MLATVLLFVLFKTGLLSELISLAWHACTCDGLKASPSCFVWANLDPVSLQLHAVVEIPRGSKVKYELDKHTGMVRIRTSWQHRACQAMSFEPLPVTSVLSWQAIASGFATR